jgi:hypothetical protein
MLPLLYRLCAARAPSQKVEDFKLVIKVAFREGVVPSQLSSLSQSGGERVVATMLYMLALQVRERWG